MREKGYITEQESQDTIRAITREELVLFSLPTKEGSYLILKVFNYCTQFHPTQ